MARQKISTALEIATRLRVESENWTGYNSNIIESAADLLTKQQNEIDSLSEAASTQRTKRASYYAWALFVIGGIVALVWSISTFGAVPNEIKRQDLNSAYSYLMDEGWLELIHSKDNLYLYRWKYGQIPPTQ